MKKYLSLIFAALGLCASAAVDVVSLGKSDTYSVDRPCLVKSIELIDANDSATYVTKKESVILGSRDVVASSVFTNFTYTSITTNDTGFCSTNVTAFDQAPFLPAAEFVLGYTTNAVVTTTTVTNTVPVVSGTVTNTVEANSWLAPGDVIFFPEADTFTGSCRIYLER